jgi:hypothetical protein
LQRPLIILFLFGILISNAQSFGSRSGPEKCWAIFHPFAAIKIRKIYALARPFYEDIKKNNVTDSFSNGGKLDAFRHIYFMAAFTQKVKAKKVRKLGKAHEKGNRKDFLKGIKEDGELPDSLSTVMDLQNNETGIRIGRENKMAALKELSELVLGLITRGEAVYFKRDAHGNYLNCENQIIDRTLYSGKWFVPKCLIKTNE